jgi:5'-nucleotidase
MKILLTNDDGILSPVLLALGHALSREHKVIVVAPSTDQSGMSQAFTHGPDKRLTFRQDSVHPYPVYQVAGTPCDCIKFAIAHICKPTSAGSDPSGPGMPDLVLSGINLGENAGMSAVYSGTVAAAREAAMWGIPALAVSVWKNSPDHLDAAVSWLARLLRNPALLPASPGLGRGVPAPIWNINFPACPPDQVEGVEVTAMSTVMFADDYEESRDAHGIPRFRLYGHKPPELFRAGTDDHALSRNRIAITPLQVEQSHPDEFRRLSALGEVWQTL